MFMMMASQGSHKFTGSGSRILEVTKEQSKDAGICQCTQLRTSGQSAARTRIGL